VNKELTKRDDIDIDIDYRLHDITLP
jgi:hypothetical protein